MNPRYRSSWWLHKMGWIRWALKEEEDCNPPMWSSTAAKPDTSVMGDPSGPANGVIPTAADNVIRAPVGSFLNSCKKARKLAESFGEMALQPIPWWLGYSQLCIKNDQISSQKEVVRKRTRNQRHQACIYLQDPLQFSQKSCDFEGIQQWRNTEIHSNRQWKGLR